MRYLLYLPANAIVTLLAYTLAPILPLFANDKGYLPNWLWWFQTPDNPLDGDADYARSHAPYKAEGPRKFYQIYINRVIWLYRNPSYGFDWTVLAFKPQPLGTRLVLNRGKKPIGGDLKSTGWYYIKVANPDGKTAWQLFIVHHWNKTHGAKINLGWKLWSIPMPCQFVCSINLWKKIT